MKDKLEKFVIENRDSFNELEPDPSLFDGIKLREAAEDRSINWMSIAWKAAAVVVIFISSYFFHDYMNRPSTGSMMASENEQASEEMQVLIDAEAFYSSQIQTAEEQISYYTTDNPELRSEITEEMKALDQMYLQLKNDLNDNVSNEEIIEAMIQNYRMKLKILEDVLYQIKKSNTNEDEKKIAL